MKCSEIELVFITRSVMQRSYQPLGIPAFAALSKD
jgi:hypothetical protein